MHKKEAALGKQGLPRCFVVSLFSALAPWLARSCRPKCTRVRSPTSLRLNVPSPVTTQSRDEYRRGSWHPEIFRFVVEQLEDRILGRHGFARRQGHATRLLRQQPCWDGPRLGNI